MHIEIQITQEPIAAEAVSIQPPLGAGALAEFTGIVRGEENGQAITALEYEAYSPMAERVMRSLLDDIGRRHPCLFVKVTHRIGLVPVGAAAIHVIAAARHRAEALALLAEFMDRLKQDVPIWKCRALNGGEARTLPTA